ncbi:hypothetical protein [Malacoplasma iowae]|uniref:hypothetical protein n=1 Tax=Malacoplasma iowae TaxID=2116 RepID=UPI0038735109|nr:lipoprotein 17-related variable surface protein [Malacoplasma iowae]
MKNKIKLMIASTIGISAIMVPSIISYTKNNNNSIGNLNTYKITNNDLTSTKDVNFLDKKSLENISTSIGPIVLKDNKTIESRDWYGYTNWSLDISTIDKTNNGSTSVVDWEYLQKSDSLFLITSNSYLIKINATTGEVLASADKTNSEIQNADRLGGIQYNDTLYVWNSKTTSTTIYSVDRNTLKKTGTTNNNSFLTTNKLQKIIPIDVGYNIAVTTENSTSSDNQNTISKLKLTLVNDSLEPLVKKEKVDSKENVQELEINITPGLEWGNIYIDGFYRSSTQSTLLFIDNKIYEVFLNKNTPNKSDIKLISNNDQANKTETTSTKSFNSSFIDSNNNVIFKRDGDKTISNLNSSNIISTPIDLSNANNNDLKQIITKDTENANKLKVYGVPTEERKDINSANNIYLVDQGSNFATGFTSNIAKPTNFYNEKLELKPNDNISITNLLPSQLNISNFKIVGNGDQINNSNNDAKFVIDDRKGELSLTLLSTRNAWYSQVSSVKTKTYLHYSNSSFKKLNDAVSWAKVVFENLYKKYTPGQITEELLDKNAESIMPSSNITTSNGYSNISRKFLIVERTDTTGLIKVEGTFTYTDKYNTTINYTLNPETFTVKKATQSDYKFEFYGQDSNGNGHDGDYTKLPAIDINQITGNQALDSLKKYIPSFINPDQDLLADAFIKTQDSYPIAKGLRNIYLKDWDNENGTVTVAVDYVGLDNKIPSSFARKFTGFKTFNQSRIDFKGNKVKKEDVPTNITSLFSDDTTYINIKDVYPEYADKISDEVNDLAKTYSDGVAALAAMGYSPIAEVKHSDNGAQYGFLQVELDYTRESTQDRKRLPKSFQNQFGLKDGKISQVYFGFLPVSTRFGISLKSYYSPEVQNIVNNYNVESLVDYNDLLKTLDYKGFLNDEIKIQNRSWDGEKLNFEVTGKSAKYPSVVSTYNFTIDWAPKFASIRERNLILAVSLTLAGIGVVAFGIGAYILRKNKIRRLLK